MARSHTTVAAHMRALGIGLGLVLITASASFGSPRCSVETLAQAIAKITQNVNETRTTSAETSASAAADVRLLAEASLTASGRDCMVKAFVQKSDDLSKLLVSGPEPLRSDVINLAITALDQNRPIIGPDIELFEVLAGDAGTWSNTDHVEHLGRQLRTRLLGAKTRRLASSDSYRQFTLASNIALFLFRIGKGRDAEELVSAIELRSAPLLHKLLLSHVRLSFAKPEDVAAQLRRVSIVVGSEISSRTSTSFDLAYEMETFVESLAVTANAIGYTGAAQWLASAPFLPTARKGRQVLLTMRDLSLRSLAACQPFALGATRLSHTPRGKGPSDHLLQIAELWIKSSEEDRAGDPGSARAHVRAAALALHALSERYRSRQELETALKPYGEMMLLYDVLALEAAIPGRWLRGAIQAADKEDAGRAAKMMVELAGGLRDNAVNDAATRSARHAEAASLAIEALVSFGWIEEAESVATIVGPKLKNENGPNIAHPSFLHSRFRLSLRGRDFKTAAATLDDLAREQQKFTILRFDYPTEAGIEPPQIGLWPADQASIAVNTPAARLQHLLKIESELATADETIQGPLEKELASVRRRLGDIILTEMKRYLTRNSRGALIYSNVTARSAGETVPSDSLRSLRKLTEELLRYRYISETPFHGSPDWSINQAIDEHLANAFSVMTTTTPALPVCLLPNAHAVRDLRVNIRGRLTQIDADRRAMTAGLGITRVADTLLSANYPLSVFLEPLQIADLKEKLQGGESVVQAIALKGEVWLVAVSYDAEEVAVVHGGSLERIEQAFASVQRTSRDPGQAFDFVSSFALFETFVKPFVRSGRATRPRVFLFLDERLSTLPVNSLITSLPVRSDDLAWLDSVADVRVEPSLEGWLETRTTGGTRPVQTGAALVMGAPNLRDCINNGSFSPARPHRRVNDLCSIPEAEDMMYMIGSGWRLREPDATVSGSEYTRPALLQGDLRSRLEAAGRVAFVTHGLSAAEAKELTGREEPAIVVTPKDNEVASGVLYGSDIVGMNLTADLVILLSCNSAQRGESGFPEQFRGMADAFLLAGARAVLAANWSVNADATARLITAFAGSNRSDDPHQALQAAMQSVRAQGFTHPYYWASFSYLGL